MLSSREPGILNPNNDVSYYALHCPAPLKNRDFVLQRSWLQTPQEVIRSLQKKADKKIMKVSCCCSYSAISLLFIDIVSKISNIEVESVTLSHSLVTCCSH